jgi:hypothetical protein
MKREEPPPTLEEQAAFLTGRAAKCAEMYGSRDPNVLMWKALLATVRRYRFLRAGGDAALGVVNPDAGRIEGEQLDAVIDASPENAR